MFCTVSTRYSVWTLCEYNIIGHQTVSDIKPHPLTSLPFLIHDSCPLKEPHIVSLTYLWMSVWSLLGVVGLKRRQSQPLFIYFSYSSPNKLNKLICFICVSSHQTAQAVCNSDNNRDSFNLIAPKQGFTNSFYTKSEAHRNNGTSTWQQWQPIWTQETQAIQGPVGTTVRWKMMWLQQIEIIQGGVTTGTG